MDGSLFDGLDEADRELLRRQIELNYLKNSRRGMTWFLVAAFAAATAVTYFTSFGPGLMGDSWDEAAGFCSQAMNGLCSAGRMQQAQEAVQFGFWFSLIIGTLLGWMVAAIVGSLPAWQRAVLSKMSLDENAGALNKAAELARQQFDNTIAHRRLQSDLRH